jgi:hypothetical protein
MEFNFSSIMQYYGFVVALDLLVFSSSDNFANANYEGLELQVYDQRVPPKIHSLAPNLDVLIPTLIIELQQGQQSSHLPIHKQSSTQNNASRK